MELSHHRIDLARHEADERPLGDVITRDHASHNWIVPFSPVVFEALPDFRHYRREQQIYIPLFPYVVPNEPADALGFAFQLGAAAIAMRPDTTKNVQRLHLSIAHPVHQVEDEATQKLMWQFHLGFALLLS